MLGAGCGDEPPDEPIELPNAPAPAPPEPPPAPVDDSPYDEDGNLLPSTDVVGGLVLPRGLEAMESGDESLHVYSCLAPPQKVVAYFGPLLLTGEVDRIGDGAVFRSGVPQHPEGTAFRMNVEVLSRGSRRSIVRIRLLGVPGAPSPRRAPTEAELRQFDRRQD